MEESKITIMIINELGLHARAAANFVKTALQFSSDIIVRKDGSEVNGKSIMALIMLSVGCKECIDIEATGADAEESLKALTELINNRFGEEK